MFSRTLKAFVPALRGAMKFSTFGMIQAGIKPKSPFLFSAQARFMATENYVKELKSPEEWEKLSKKLDTPTIIEFYAKWCGPCKTLGPVIEKNVKNAEGKIALVKVDIDECGEVAQEFEVKAIPHVSLYHKGKVVDYFVGVSNDETIIKFFREAKKLAEKK